MIALQHERPGRFFIVIRTGPGRPAQLHIRMDYSPVMDNLFKSGISNLSPLVVKAGGAENDIKCLPLFGRA
jgi:hypothetical protein